MEMSTRTIRRAIMLSATGLIFVIALVIDDGGLVFARQPQGPFVVPDYDIRIAIEEKTISEFLFHLYPLSYGNIVRLNETPINCGDPEFVAALNFPPAFQLSGLLDTTTGQSSASITLYLGMTGRIPGGCKGLEGVEVFADLNARLERVSDLSRLALTGTARVRPFGSQILELLLERLQTRQPIEQYLELPTKVLGKLPLSLADGDGVEMDFGTFCAHCPGSWASSGKTKELPLVVNVGAPNDSTFLAVDVTFGSEPRTRIVASGEVGENTYDSDKPIWSDANQPRNLGVSIRDSALSKVDVCGLGGSAFDAPKPCDEGRGLFRELLPIRVKGTTKITSTLDLEYAVILSGAEVTPVELQGKPARRVSLSSRYTGFRTVRHTTSGLQVSKPWSPAESVKAALVIHELRVEDGKIKFDIDDFKITLKPERPLLGLPSEVSTPDLSALVNNGSIPLPVEATPSLLEVPECIAVGEKFKAADFRCGHPGKAIGWLSRDGHPGFEVQVNPDSFAIKDQPWLMASAQLTYTKRPDIPVDALKALRSGLPVLVTRWRSTVPGDYGEAQCGNIGGTRYAPLDRRSDAIRMDTDERPGGCTLEWAIIDPPPNTLGGLVISVDWQPSGDDGQCKGRLGRPRQIPILSSIPMSETDITFSPFIGVDTDDASGGCYMTFSLSGRTDIALDIWFWPEDDPGQCEPAMRPDSDPLTVVQGAPATLFVDTDRRWGGCVQQMRLRRQ